MTARAPIVLFVYARPDHTRRTLEALSRCRGAGESFLHVFSDGAKPGADRQQRDSLSEVRRVIHEKAWCGRVEVVESTANKGLAASIVQGVTEVVERHGRAIVLEDDLEVSPGFLDYMNAALDCYQSEERVYQVSGWMPRHRRVLRQTGFLRISTSWGWATWDRAWRNYESDAESLLKRVEEIDRTGFDLEGCSFHFEELADNVSGKLSTWHVKWYASLFLRDGLCLYPHRSLVRNLGFDGSGEHCHDEAEATFARARLASSIRVRPQDVRESESYFRAMQGHYRRQYQRWTHSTFKDRIVRKLRALTGMSAEGRAS